MEQSVFQILLLMLLVQLLMGYVLTMGTNGLFGGQTVITNSVFCSSNYRVKILIIVLWGG
jgi:hypothetical protein